MSVLRNAAVVTWPNSRQIVHSPIGERCWTKAGFVNTGRLIVTNPVSICELAILITTDEIEQDRVLQLPSWKREGSRAMV
jgi:hypothetical protein